MPFSYAQYTGNGSTTTFSVPFPYLLKAHVKLYTGFSILDGTFTSQLVDGVGYTWTSNTQVQITAAPAAGVVLTIIRDTPDSGPLVPWQDGSNLVADDFNTSDLQNLYVVQEQQDRNDAGTVLSQSASAAAAAATATANTALSNSTAAQTAAASAVSTANTANTTAASALSTANTKGDAAIASAAAAQANATAAVATANAASSAASNAVSSAAAANTTAAAAVSTANTADVKADAAIAAVASSVNYTAIANVAAIPASPANNTYIEVQDTTGLESFTPMAGRPAGFVGDSGLKARLRFTTSGSTWNWIDYAPTDADGRYLKKSGGTMTGALTLSGAPSSNLHAATKQYVDAVEVQAVNAQSTANTAVSNAAAAQSTANTGVANAATAQSTANAALPKAGGTMTGAITFAGGQNFPSSGLATASTSLAGIVQLNDSTSSTSSTTAATSAAVKAVQDFAQVVSSTASAAMPKAGGTFTGDVTFNTTTATVLPVGSTAQRPSGSTGMVRYNSTLGGFEGFSGAGWGSLGGGATGGASDKVFVETDQTITTSYTLTAGKNAMTAGPVTVASGATVTVPSGAAWVIV